MKKALLATLLLQACSPKPPPPLLSTAPQVATSDGILARLKQSVELPAGARVVHLSTDAPFPPSGRISSSDGHREAYQQQSFVLDLSGLDVQALLKRGAAVDPAGFRADKIDDLKTWDDVRQAARMGTVLLQRLSHALALQQADRFSGLALSMERRMLTVSPEDAGEAVVLSDVTGANVIQVTAWVALAPARAQVGVTYFAHTGGRNARVTGPPPAWGTRK